MKNASVHRGFTLIELLVSVALFSVVMVIALGALLSLSVADRRAETIKSAIDNLTSGVDSMSRAIRTGYNYHCLSGGLAGVPQDCVLGGDYLTFISATGAQVYYQLDTSSATCGQTGTIGCIERSTDGSIWYPITSPDLVIQNNGYLFHVLGAAQGDGIQPKVIITTSGIVQISSTASTTFHLQTTVTQRIYDQ